MLEFIFWTGVFLVFYAYLGYGLVLYMWLALRRRGGTPSGHIPPVGYPNDNWPQVSFVVCAYNEAGWMEQKISNSIAVDYPPACIHFLFVTDGSTDATPDLVRRYPFPSSTQWQLLHEPERRGKIAAFQRAMRTIQTPFVISTDANTLVNPAAVKNMMRHFADARTAAVAGEKRISMGERDNASSAGEGIYWQYESTLKRWDSALWSVVGAAGELFAFRRSEYEDVPNDTIVEDFYMTMRMAQKGGRVQYEPDAYAVESSSASVSEELKRKVRIAAGAWQAVVRLAPLLNIFRYGVLSFQYISHRVLRWTLAPALLPVVFVVNALLAIQKGPFYRLLFALQCLFYGAAFAGYLLEKRHLKVKALFVPYYFCVMNYAQYAGFWRFLRGRQSVLWERAQRAS